VLEGVMFLLPIVFELSPLNLNGPRVIMSELRFSERLESFLDSEKVGIGELANRLSIAPDIVMRWLKNTASPTRDLADELESLGMAKIHDSETNHGEIARVSGTSVKEKRLSAESIKAKSDSRLLFNGKMTPVMPMPYVRNGPPNQNHFQSHFIELQINGLEKFDEALQIKRMALVESVNHTETCIFKLENPKIYSVSWNSNYGTHGWHRYVGRFPPHLVRALLNYFGADKNSTVLDPFLGSGTTGVECRLLGIPFQGVEICPLSHMMSSVKSKFPQNTNQLHELRDRICDDFTSIWMDFLDGKSISEFSHSDIIDRKGNTIEQFANIERWFTVEALLGTSIFIELAMKENEYLQDFLLIALSSKMRSIGNVNVDTVRAQYSKNPRQNVDVKKLMISQINKMINSIDKSNQTHSELIGSEDTISIQEGSILDANIPKSSINFVITSPPYGVESLSYLRTHLLSYRTMSKKLKHDPYKSREKTIGSEYLGNTTSQDFAKVEILSPTFADFYSVEETDSKMRQRRLNMMQFFEDMRLFGIKMANSLVSGGKMAFIIGNKTHGDRLIPSDTIIKEIFESCGLVLEESFKHKLKTNNSNSQVPWQSRIIDQEFIMIFTKRSG